MKHDVANLLGPEKCEKLMELLGELRESKGRPRVTCGIPDWGANLTDLRDMLRWDQS